jgi:hypothetical protein
MGVLRRELRELLAMREGDVRDTAIENWIGAEA